jgi:dihydropteroate synthase
MPAIKRTLIMGVVNVTPDSFSDGGLFLDPKNGADHALRLIDEGADILDIGGESTRPATFSDNAPLDPNEELKRVIPVIKGIRAHNSTISISIDTYKSIVAKAALDEGADIVNDISGMSYDRGMAALVAGRGCKVVLMHLPGRPRSVLPSTRTADIVADIIRVLHERVQAALQQGIQESSIILDPGIGFGKDTYQNLEILRRLREIAQMGYPLLVAPSRKRFIGNILGTSDPSDRLEGTAAAVAVSVVNGADIVRVHDVKQMVKLVKMTDAIVRGWAPDEE